MYADIGHAGRRQAGQSLLRTLAHPDRLLLLCRMVEGVSTVGKLADRIGSAEPAMSQFLAWLRHERLVRAERGGQTRYYAIARPDVILPDESG